MGGGAAGLDERMNMITITVTPPNQPSFSREFTTVSDAYDFLMTLHTEGYDGAREAAEVKPEPADFHGEGIA